MTRHARAVPVATPEVATPLRVAVVALAVVDTALMLAFWSFEGNPLLLGAGPVAATALKLLPVAALVACWRLFPLANSRVALACLWVLAGLYGAAAGSNLVVVMAA